jgi:type I restriction enzyme R subunit
LREEVAHFEAIRKAIKIASGDYIDLKTFEPMMRHLLDTYIRAEDSEKIAAFDDLSLIKLLVKQGASVLQNLPKSLREADEASAEAIENNLRRVIVDEQPINPKYYDKMSTLLDELIQQRKEKAVEYKMYLQKLRDLSRQVIDPDFNADYPSSIDTAGKRALYDNLGKNAALAIVLDKEICSTKKDSWRGNKIKEREVLAAIRKHVAEQEVEVIFEIVKNQKDY